MSELYVLVNVDIDDRYVYLVDALAFQCLGVCGVQAYCQRHLVANGVTLPFDFRPPAPFDLVTFSIAGEGMYYFPAPRRSPRFLPIETDVRDYIEAQGVEVTGQRDGDDQPLGNPTQGGQDHGGEAGLALQHESPL